MMQCVPIVNLVGFVSLGVFLIKFILLMKSSNFRKAILFLSIVMSVFFAFIAFYNLNGLQYSGVDIVGELITIPFLIITIAISILSLINWIKIDSWQFRSSYLLSFSISLLTLVILLFLE